MTMHFDTIVYLPSGNTARGFNVRDLGNGRVKITYVYTDRRRAHQVARHFTADFLNGRLQLITARSARGGRVEAFSTSIIVDVLFEMLSKVNSSNFRKDATEMHAAETIEVETNEQDSASVEGDTDLMSILRTVGCMVMVNILITLATLGIVWYKL